MEDFNPEGLHILAIDADQDSLNHLQTLLLHNKYQVTTTTSAAEALRLLRDKNNKFDIVMTDVVGLGDDVDGFKLLEIFNLEMQDIPVIIVSADNRTESILKGLRYGVKDFLPKPVRSQDIQLIWQHVYRMKVESSRKQSSSYNKEHIVHSVCKRKKPETILKSESDQKRPRVRWTRELHAKYLDACNKVEKELGSRLHPKRILEVMDVPFLTRDKVASHLQRCQSTGYGKAKPSIQSIGQNQLKPSSETSAQGMFHSNCGNFPYEYMTHGYGCNMIQNNTMLFQPPMTSYHDPRMEHSYLTFPSPGQLEGTDSIECVKDDNMKGQVQGEDLMKYDNAEDNSTINGVEDIASSSHLDADLCGFQQCDMFVNDLWSSHF